MRLVVLAFCALAVASAAPMLRLSNSVVGPLAVAEGASPPPQTLEASNIGDGTLALTMTVERSATWLATAVGAPRSCLNTALQRPCYPLQFYLNTAGLPAGTYTGQVTVSDPLAIDAPQVVTVTVRVGVPPTVPIDRYLAPGSTTSIQIAQCCPIVTAATEDGGTWMSIVLSGVGTIRSFYTYFVYLNPPATMASGTYRGSVSVDAGVGNRSVIPITMRVTTQPVAVPSAGSLSVRLAEGGPPMTYPFLPYISLSNSGIGTLAVQDVTASGPGLSAYNYNGLAIVSADPGSLPAGTYNDGAVTIRCNAANCPLRIPVTIEIVTRNAPVIRYGGVVDNASFLAGNPVSPGDIVIAKGEQLSLRAPEFSGVPLATSLGGANVLVNDVLAPLYYSSSGQIAFRIPSSASPGTARVQVIRDGVAGNTVSVNIAARAPRILAVTTADNQRIDAQHPVKAGGPLIVWAIGLGPTTPSVPDGALPQGLAPLTVTPSLSVFGTVVRHVTPDFAGLSGGAVGVYQVNVTVPADFPPGSQPAALNFPDAWSEPFTIWVR